MPPAQTPQRVGHVHLKVRDLDRATAFYERVLGLQQTEQTGRFVFLSWGSHHHDVALQEVGADAPGPGPDDAIGLYHVAFEVDTADALRAVYDRVADSAVAVTPVDHGISKALYFDDPDGNGIEVYLDTRDSAEERWNGTNTRFDPAAL